MKKIEDFKPGDVAGFTLAGWLQKDGSVVLVSSGEVLPAIPQEIMLNGTTYGFEKTNEFQETWRGVFVNIEYC